MDPCLTQGIPVSMPVWRKYSAAPKIKGYSQISSLTPILGNFFGTMPESEGQIQSDELFGKLVEFEGSGPCIVEGVNKKKKDAFCKVTHLLDPIRTIQSYYTNHVKGEKRKQNKLKNPMNQAYIDGLANYLLGQLRERNISPHFCLFYGAFQGIAKAYRYNITNEFDSYRKYRGFWEKRKEGIFSIHITYDNDEDEEIDEDNHLLHTPTSSLHSTEFNYSTPRSNRSNGTQRTHISIQNEAVPSSLIELESVDSIPSADEIADEQDNSQEYSDDDEDDVSVYIELKDYPVMLIFQEHMEGVLDDLLEKEETFEEVWTAWTFQVIAALCVAQGVLGFTHNDLHTNNIVWRKTSQEYLYYKTRSGTIFRVPTYGKIFSIIDFGRSIFRVNESWFISDDYEKGGDAEGQYNFGPLSSSKEETVYPNPSFDLCRYSVSIIEALFPETPTEVVDGIVLSKEGSWIVRETESPLWNLLWSWLIDENGKNVLFDEDNVERFPDFDLYQHISKHVKDVAKPQDQVFKEIFRTYKVNPKDVSNSETVYPLFC